MSCLDKHLLSAIDSLTVDGVKRPTRNTLGQLIHHSIAGIQNFWRWFGHSGQVDATGRPRVFYHGSPETGVDRFVPGAGKALNGDAYGVAIYMTTSPQEASFYARGEGCVYPLYVRGQTIDVQSPALPAEHAERLTRFAATVLLPSDKARFTTGRRIFTTESAQDARDFFDTQLLNWAQFGDGMCRAKPCVLDRLPNDRWSVEYTDYDAAIDIATGADALTLFKAVGMDNLPAAGFDGMLLKREGGADWFILHRPDYNLKSALGNDGSFDLMKNSIADKSQAQHIAHHDCIPRQPALL